jgi:hypothetical protein
MRIITPKKKTLLMSNLPLFLDYDVPSKENGKPRAIVLKQ